MARPPRAARRAGVRSTTPVTWTRRGLPGPVRAEVGVPTSEALVSLLIVVIVFAPPIAISGGSVWFVAAAAVVLAALSYVLWARRVLVGDSWVAVRQLGRFHVASADHLRHLELRPTAHGGVLCLHTDDGRCMRLRRVEVARPDVNAALRELSGVATDTTHDRRVLELLTLPLDETRLRHRYVADLLQ